MNAHQRRVLRRSKERGLRVFAAMLVGDLGSGWLVVRNDRSMTLVLVTDETDSPAAASVYHDNEDECPF